LLAVLAASFTSRVFAWIVPRLVCCFAASFTPRVFARYVPRLFCHSYGQLHVSCLCADRSSPCLPFLRPASRLVSSHGTFLALFAILAASFTPRVFARYVPRLVCRSCGQLHASCLRTVRSSPCMPFLRVYGMPKTTEGHAMYHLCSFVSDQGVLGEDTRPSHFVSISWRWIVAALRPSFGGIKSTC
jgi:hypothetical protein